MHAIVEFAEVFAGMDPLSSRGLNRACARSFVRLVFLLRLLMSLYFNAGVLKGLLPPVEPAGAPLLDL